MIHERLDRILVILLLLALAVLGTALGAARRLGAAAPPPGAPVDSLVIPETAPPAPVPPPVVVARTVAKAPFRPDRTPPAERYQLPNPTPSVMPNANASAPPRLPGVALLGTVLYPDGRGLAALTLPGRQPRLVRVGESFEGYRLKAVTRTEATLVGADTTLTLRSPSAPSQPAPKP